MYNTKIEFEDKEVINILKNILEEKKIVSAEQLFWKMQIQLNQDTDNAVENWVYQHYNVDVDDNVLQDFVNWQMIEHYIIKNSYESQIENNYKLRADDNNIENVIYKFEKQKLFKIRIKWKNYNWHFDNIVYLWKNNDDYIVIYFKQNWSWYKKNIKNIIDWYKAEFVYWKYLYNKMESWEIDSFQYTNYNNIKSWKVIENNWKYSIDFSYNIWKEWNYDFQIKDSNWIKYIDLKWLKLSQKSSEFFDESDNIIWTRNFYIKFLNFIKDNDLENLYFVPLWHRDADVYIFDYNYAPNIWFFKKNIENIEKNTDIVINNIWKLKNEQMIWRSRKISVIIAKTNKVNKIFEQKISNQIHISKQKFKWKNIKMLETYTISWINLENFIVYYGKWAENFGKVFKKSF